ncbi:MAG: DUF6036 family nucleotidyltransferase [Candidatus Thorarchaeota archaeon]
MEEFPEILQFVCSYLTENEIDYVVVGGVAVMYHGVPRTTVDIDLILQIDDDDIPAFVDFLNSNRFSATVQDMKVALKEKSHSTVFFANSLLRLDIQGVNSNFDRMTLDRAILIELFDTPIKLGTAEDTIINKILFQGEQDLRDALGILSRKEHELDFTYIESTCKQLKILDGWRSFLKESTNKMKDGL